MKVTAREQKLLSRVLRELGRKGGRASARVLTPEQRTARARKAGRARQAKVRAARNGGAR